MRKTQAIEHPGTAQPKSGVNHRKAQAGLIKLRNPAWSMRRCLEEAGYSKQTSRCPKANGLSESLCIEEAWKLQPDPKPDRILRKARVLLDKKMDLALAHPEDLRGSKFSDVARMIDTVERSYAGTDEAIDRDARSFADRLKWMYAITQELQSRGTDSAVDRAITVDGVVIDAEPEDSGTSEN